MNISNFVSAMVGALITVSAGIASAQSAPQMTKPCKTLADDCGTLTAGPKMRQFVPKTNIEIIGKTPDGKYNVYNLHTNGVATLGPWTVGNTLYTENALIPLLNGIDAKDAARYECETVCVDKQERVVGVLQSYKDIKLPAASKKKR